MKTILVVYVKDKKVSDQEAYKMKKYSFNTDSEVEVGDLIESPAYDSLMQVVSVLDEAFEYVNIQTGELSSKFNSTSQYKIRQLVIQTEEAANQVLGKKK